MSSRRFWTIYILLVICQMVLCNYFNLSPRVSASILPAMVVCIPRSVTTPWAMLIAFATGLLVDFAADAVPGLNALALVPVAFCRTGILRLILGGDISERTEQLSFRTKGFAKVSGICAIAVALFIAIYVIADGAGTRPLLFNLSRFAASAVVSFVLSLAVVAAFSPKSKL